MKELEHLFIKTFNQTPLQINNINAHGSNRKYFRIISENITCIGVYNEDKQENIAFISYAKQLQANNIKVPQIYAEDLNNNVYLQQDLGDTTLFSFLQTNTQQNVDSQYEKVLKQLPKIQTIKNFDYTNAYPRKYFDKQSINWDLNYFKYYFLRLAEIPFNEQDLENDFNNLTSYLLTTNTSYFMYRDFQSRNIMLFDNDIYFIDFQGGRQGALQYDIASLLYDAKANLSIEQRQKFLEIYLDELEKYIDIDRYQFKQYYYAYVYIRIMQAMGSYGYRGYFEHKTEFLKSIPFALNNLQYLQDNIKLDVNINTLNEIFQKILNCDKLKKLNKKKSKLTVTIKSFSYKKGYPHDLSGNGGGYVFDCRALPNPGKEERFWKLNGLDQEVKDFLDKSKEMDYFMENVINLVTQSINTYLDRGFSNLSIYFGCTGGQHRSVYAAQRCANILSQNTDLNIITHHVEQNIKKKFK